MKFNFFDKTNDVLIKILDSVKENSDPGDLSLLAGSVASVYSANDESEAHRLAANAVLLVADYQARYWNKQGFKEGIRCELSKI